MNGDAPSTPPPLPGRRTPPPLPDLRETKRPRSRKPFRDRFPRLRAACAEHELSFDHLALAWGMGVTGSAGMLGFLGALGTSGAEMLFMGLGLSPALYVMVNQMDAPRRQWSIVWEKFGVSAFLSAFFVGGSFGMIILACRGKL